MRFRPTRLAGVYIVEPEPHVDERGHFVRTWCAQEAHTQGLDPRIAQCSLSFNRRAGTLRGMHYQAAPHAEVKWVRCVRGAAYDVILDLRPGSATFKEWLAVTLSADSGLAVYVPEGFAHGFQTLEDDTELLYQMSVPFHPQSARAVRWDDPAFGIEWPAGPRILSERDRTVADFEG